VAAIVSQAVIVTSWNDAKAGTVVNAVMLLAAAFGYLAQGPRSFTAEYRRHVEAALAEASAEAPMVTEADLAGLPEPVAGYLRRSGAVGQPHVRTLQAAVHGRIRSAPGNAWMPFTGEQVNSFGASPCRMFHITARMSGLPVDVLHVFSDQRASMRGRAGYLIPVLDATGPDLDRAETVTLFNDLCVLAPAALANAPISWQPIDARHTRGSFTLGRHIVTAELVFDHQHDLIDFVSDDRLRAEPGGHGFTRQRWSTPLDGYRTFGPRRLATGGEGRWHAPQPEGEFAYLEYRLDDIRYNPPAPTQTSARSRGNRSQPVTAAPQSR
jgi:hypothetical protein